MASRWALGHREEGEGAGMQAAHPLPHPLQGLCPFLPNNTAQEEHRSEAHQGLSRGPGLELSPPWVSGCPQR